MTRDMRSKYGADIFDPDDAFDAKAERARQAMIDAFLRVDGPDLMDDGEAMQAVAAGLLVGLACAIGSAMQPTDENHASLRAGLIELIPWAIDMMRSMPSVDLPPLSDKN